MLILPAIPQSLNTLRHKMPISSTTNTNDTNLQTKDNKNNYGCVSKKTCLQVYKHLDLATTVGFKPEDWWKTNGLGQLPSPNLTMLADISSLSIFGRQSKLVHP